MTSQSRVYNPLIHPFLFLFQLFQWLTDKILSPNPPGPSTRLSRPKIAVIGAGITGVTSAAHCIGHGFDVTIFEAGSEDELGGIWSRVNNTSSLQIHSVMYRFHPSVKWERGYPDRQQILSQQREVNLSALVGVGQMQVLFLGPATVEIVVRATLNDRRLGNVGLCEQDKLVSFVEQVHLTRDVALARKI